MDVSLRREDFSTLPGWADDAPAQAFTAFRRSAEQAIRTTPYRTGSLGLAHAELAPAYAAALAESGSLSDLRAREFFEAWFRPVEICPGSGAGLVTGYYEPEIAVRSRPDSGYRFPFLRKPDNLVPVADPDNPPASIPAGFAFMLDDGGLATPCPDRAAIETGALDGRGLEIAWAASRVDVFFAHVQGCARLRFADGRLMRINYAAKSGHPFTAIGRLLVERGELSAATVSMAAIRNWLAVDPERADRLMRENRSYIFFKETELNDESSGPVGAAGVSLEAGRSLAVDHRIHSFGTPVFVIADGLADFDAPRSFARLMIAQDTGTAITGPVRGDLFAGSGPAAGDKAGSVKAAARFVVLAPRDSEMARRAGHER
ncbi:transglycosylase [Hoeflea sp. BAL378]|uniref:murein transglycosylase A n=1 Tax=Hoeflea sp. BAL378 TaxID=1547437 RepID=UPI000513F6B3|nr:MltA domain-containing protein [Hoeflea sp. BAL378]KGF69917.1 transglycosylase [Hoeflea sp. BAL378]